MSGRASPDPPVDLPAGEPLTGDEHGSDAHRPYYPDADIYLACRVGDAAKVASLIRDSGVDPNARDRWDSVPLYYACLTGHLEVVQVLLEAGAVANEYTFDGDRCHYAALNLAVRKLLRRYEARPPPLRPLAGAVRGLCSLMDDPEGVEGAGVWGEGDRFADLRVRMGGEAYELHRAIMAARLPYVDDLLEGRRRMRSGTVGPPVEELTLAPGVLNNTVLEALIAYIYTERVDIDMDLVRRLRMAAKHFRCNALVRMIDRELLGICYYFKSTRREDAPRRFVLQPAACPPEASLNASLGNLRSRSRVWEEALQRPGQGPQATEEDYADVALRLQDRVFRAHKCILSCRSEYFKVVFQPGLSASYAPLGWCTWPAMGGHGAHSLPELQMLDVAAESMELVLQFVYSHEVGPLPAGFFTDAARPAAVFDVANRLLLFPMKRLLAEQLIMGMADCSFEFVCRLAIEADIHSVGELREHCLGAIAMVLDPLMDASPGEEGRNVLEAFVAAVAPEDLSDVDRLLDGSGVPGASRGCVEGGGLGGLGMGTLLQDLREKYLEISGAEGSNRDEVAGRFDTRLLDFTVASRGRM
eukprot:evm.model.scf_13EXC.1 EVM.evm.TU.scf_13EXC.1   scf_13EXC:58203-61583(+)